MENRFENTENNLEAYWDSLRNRNHDDSLPAVAEWIREQYKNVRKSKVEKRKRRKRSGWLVIAGLAVCLILSSAVRIDRVEEAGKLVNFSIDKKEGKAFSKLTSLQQTLLFSCYEFLVPNQTATRSFIFFVSYNEQPKLSLIATELKLLNGIRNLDISPVNFTISESLFSTFSRRTLKLGKHPTPKKEQLAGNIQITLKNKGLDFFSIDVSGDDESVVTFGTIKPDPNSFNATDKDSLTAEIKSYPRDTIKRAAAGLDKLQNFNWLLGSWKVKYVPQETYHYWLRMNDSLLICFIIKYPDKDLIQIGDGGPEVTVGFSITYSKTDSAILSLRGIDWEFLSANEQEIRFKNETTPKSANVKWSIGNDRKTWQSAISGEKNLEVVNLVRDEKDELETIVNKFIAKHPELINRAPD